MCTLVGTYADVFALNARVSQYVDGCACSVGNVCVPSLVGEKQLQHTTTVTIHLHGYTMFFQKFSLPSTNYTNNILPW